MKKYAPLLLIPFAVGFFGGFMGGALFGKEQGIKHATKIISEATPTADQATYGYVQYYDAFGGRHAYWWTYVGGARIHLTGKQIEELRAHE